MTEPALGHPADATGETMDALLRRCVQCGLCLPVCATWVATGDETMSPRGRLLLLGDLRAAGSGDDEPLESSVALALSTCIGCQACSAVCPSGVPFALLEGAVSLAAARPPVGVAPGVGPAPVVPGPLVDRLDTPAVLRMLGLGATLGRGALRVFGGRRWRTRFGHWPLVGSLARLAGVLPRAPGPDGDLVACLDRLAGVGRTRPRRLTSAAATRVPIVWFAGCANEGLLPHSSRRLRDLLRWAGADLVTPTGATCCGALAAHGGRPDRARRQREQNLACWGSRGGATSIVTEAKAIEAIVTEAAGCGVAVRGYGPLLPAPQVDAMVWLAGARRPAFGAVPLKVALHDPCHARHGQGIVAEPRALLRGIPGLTLLEPAEAEVCCGSGGLWGLRHRALSEALGTRKAQLLAATGADLIVTANPGCLGQIADGLACLGGGAPPVLPLGDLLWYAALRARA